MQLVGLSIAVIPSWLKDTVAGRAHENSQDAGLRVNVLLLMVESFRGSLNVALTDVVIGTPVA